MMKIFTQSVIQFTKTKPLLLGYIKNSARNAQEKYVLSPWRQTLTNTVWANVNIKYRKFLQYLNWRDWTKYVKKCHKVFKCLFHFWLTYQNWIALMISNQTIENLSHQQQRIASDICWWKWRNCRSKKIHRQWQWRWMLLIIWICHWD